MSFKDILGQEKAISFLIKSLKENKILSSYLFIGSEGIGKKLTAIEIAKSINCINLNNNFEACDKCITCRKIDKQSHPDLKIIQPIKDSVTIGQIREMCREINLKPFESNKSIYIVDQAEDMTIEASNCLLKTIEEPPDYAVIILICKNLNSVLPTIISRCQIINFNLVASLKIKELLLRKIKIEEDKNELISRLAQGSIGRAFKLITDKEYFTKREELLSYLIKISPGKYDYNFFNSIEKILKDLNQMDELLEIILLWYRDILVFKEIGLKEYLVNCDKLDILRDKSKIYSQKMLIDILDYIEQIREFMDRNINKRLISERLYLKIAGVEYCQM